MPKIYWKTIGLVVAIVGLGALRANAIVQFFVFATPLEPNLNGLLDLLIVMAATALVINEKLTKGERWHAGHYLLLVLVPLIFIYLRQMWITWLLR